MGWRWQRGKRGGSGGQTPLRANDHLLNLLLPLMLLLSQAPTRQRMNLAMSSRFLLLP